MTELEIVIKEKWKVTEYDGEAYWVEDVIMAEPSGFVICYTLIEGVAEKIVEQYNKTIGDI